MTRDISLNFGTGGYLIIQCIFFLVHYGFEKKLPFILLFAPSIIYGLLFVICIFLLILIIIIQRRTD